MSDDTAGDESNLVATRAEGLRRLADFLPSAGRAYAEGRNTDPGPGSGRVVSGLSPYLRYRLLTEGEVIAAARRRHGPVGAEKFVNEVLWRTYFKGWLELRPAAWTRFLTERDAARNAVARSAALAQRVAEAEEGRTGIEGFDEWARELATFGTLHNHARMWFASIWIFTLRLPWALGADLFLRRLVDADPASNTLSWRWVAGLHTPGKTYRATADNIARYTLGRFNPKGLASEAPALVEPPLEEARPLPASAPVPTGPALLLLHPDDLAVTSLVPAGVEIVGALVSGCASDGWPWSPTARRFVADGMADAAARVRARFGCPAVLRDDLAPEEVIATARDTGARCVITPYAPVGPVAEALEGIEDPVREAGLPLARLWRRWDEALWPRATGSYFRFRNRCPEEVLAEPETVA